MKAYQAFGDLESKEFVIANSTGYFFSPAKGRHSKWKTPWVLNLNDATVYKTWQHAEKVIKKNKFEFAQYLSLKEAKELVV